MLIKLSKFIYDDHLVRVFIDDDHLVRDIEETRTYEQNEFANKIV